MKHIYLLLIFITSFVVAQSQEFVKYEVQIDGKSEYSSWPDSYIDPSYRLPWVVAILDSARTGSLQVYDYHQPELLLSTTQVKERLTPTDTIIVYDPKTDLPEQITITISDNNLYTPSHLEFKEKWTWNDSTGLSKEVLEVGLLSRDRDPYDDYPYGPKFLLRLMSGPNNVVYNKEITPLIMHRYEFDQDTLNSGESIYNKDWWLKWCQEQLMLIATGKKQSYQIDYRYWNFQLEPISAAKVMESWKDIVDSVDLSDPANFVVEENLLVGIKTREAWYWSAEKGFEKKVLAIAPMIKVFDGEGRIRGTYTAFWLKFD